MISGVTENEFNDLIEIEHKLSEIYVNIANRAIPDDNHLQAYLEGAVIRLKGALMVYSDERREQWHTNSS